MDDKFIILDSVGSTSSYLSDMGQKAEAGTVVMAREQTAGRGQRGNSWEAEPGANITLSLLLRPRRLHPARQFLISQAVSVAIARLLERHLHLPVNIKWPNDIYVRDKKICGILIENTISGEGIDRTIVGIGLNVNQRVFLSDAPNPVSMLQLSPDSSFDVMTIAKEMTTDIIKLTNDIICDDAKARLLQDTYFSKLWRAGGWYPYRDNLRGLDMSARIVSVDDMGILTLEDRTDNSQRQYAFKEITFIL